MKPPWIRHWVRTKKAHHTLYVQYTISTCMYIDCVVINSFKYSNIYIAVLISIHCKSLTFSILKLLSESLIFSRITYVYAFPVQKKLRSDAIHITKLLHKFDHVISHSMELITLRPPFVFGHQHSYVTCCNHHFECQQQVQQYCRRIG